MGAPNRATGGNFKFILKIEIYGFSKLKVFKKNYIFSKINLPPGPAGAVQ